MNPKTPLIRPVGDTHNTVKRLVEYCTLRLGERPSAHVVRAAMLRQLLDIYGTDTVGLLALSRDLFPNQGEHNGGIADA